MTDWNGTMKVSWRLGVLITIVVSVVGGAVWAGRFTERVDNMSRELITILYYSQQVGVKVALLKEQQAADDVGDQAVEKRLEQIEQVLVRIEGLLQRNLRKGGYQ